MFSVFASADNHSVSTRGIEEKELTWMIVFMIEENYDPGA